MVVGVGFEPTYATRADLQSAAFNHSATPPCNARLACRKSATICQYESEEMPRKNTHPRAERASKSIDCPSGSVLIWGRHAAASALSNPRRKIKSLYVTEQGLAWLQGLSSEHHLKPTLVSKGVLEAALTAEEKAVHQGVLVCASPLESPSLEDWLSSMPQRCVVLVLDQVTDSRNIGAIMRNAWAFETSAIITTHRHCPKENGVMLRAASGASEHIPLIKVVNLARALETLKDSGFAVAGMSAEGDAPISALAKEERLAIILGAEGKGLRRLTEEKADMLVRIPINDRASSLNVSVAAAIALFASRQ